MQTSVLIGIPAIALYLLSGVMVGLRLSRGAAGLEQSKTRVLALGGVAALLHAYVLFRGVVSDGGLNLGFFNAFSLIGWLMVVLLLVTAANRPVENLGIGLLPLAALALSLDLAFPSHHELIEAGQWKLDAHILLSVVAYSLLSIAALQAVLLAVQDWHLRHRHPGGFVRALPPLQEMEALLFQMIGMGFVLLSLSLLTGFLFIEDIFAQHLVHKTVLSIAAWLVFAILLYGRRRFGWRGRTAIRWTLGGFFALMLAYFGSKLVLELVLGR